jgi:dipeptidyl aminopeptidase/acylaminoacyl peptidase
MKAMQRDIRQSSLYREAEAIHLAFRRPGTGQLSDAAEVNVSPDGRSVVFSGTLLDRLEGVPSTRICMTDLANGDTRVLSFGPNTDRLPKLSPDGRQVAFLSDRHEAGDFQLHLLDPTAGAARAACRVEGWVEYLHWSPNGTRILLGVAGHGADVSGGQGAVTSRARSAALPSWMPTVEVGNESHRWRKAWIYELTTNSARVVSAPDCNVWEAVWCGDDALAIVASPGPGEGLWYSAGLYVLSLSSGSSRLVQSAEDRQIGWPAASPSGKYLAFVRALCSDRWVVAGDLWLLETSGEAAARRVDTAGIDVTCTEWRSERTLLISGHRGFETAVGLYDAPSFAFRECWKSTEISVGGRYITTSGLGDQGDCVLVGEGFRRAPEVAVIRGGAYRRVRSFDLGYVEEAAIIDAIEQVSWKAPDGLEIQGWLLRPQGRGPHPLIMDIHGGPVWQWRPRCLGRAGVQVLMLVKAGYAVFFPNPRGSTGRGQEFVQPVLGDMGGADTLDYLSGIDHLVDRGSADPKRLGVTGGSYGGFMTSWLITQDTRFAAAVPVAPVTNQVTEHLISNIPHFVALFLADSYRNAGGKYFQRSPIMHAHRVKTPTLNICGTLDRCTPPEEAVQFHNALLENGVKSILVTYPEEGHGIRGLPAAVDYAARVVGWFEEHMGAETRSSKTRPPLPEISA